MYVVHPSQYSIQEIPIIAVSFEPYVKFAIKVKPTTVGIAEIKIKENTMKEF